MSAGPKRSLMDDFLGAMDGECGSSPPRARKPPPSKASGVAAWLLAEGFHPTMLYSSAEKPKEKGKRPIGEGWGLERPTVDAILRIYAGASARGVGVCLGPGKGPGGRWLVDLEGDKEGAEDSLAELLGGEVVETMGWSSARGRHRLFFADERFLEALAAAGAKEGSGPEGVGKYELPELPGLEIRVGGFKPDGVVKQVHSACPPTVGTDGAPRAWSGCWEVAELPDAVFAKLEAIAERRAIQTEAEEPVSIPIHRDPFAATAPKGGGRSAEERAALYLEKIDPAVSGERGHNKAFYAACKIGPGFDLPPEVAFRLIRDLYNPRCQPPWSEKELRHKIDDAYKAAADRGFLLNKPLEAGPVGSTARRASEPPPPVDWSKASAADLGVIPLTSVKPRRVNWLWPNRLAEGEMSLVAGEGGLGKSQVLLQIAATISVGGEWPDKVGRAPLGHVYILAAEDAPDTTIVPRLMAMGADLSKIDVISAEHVVKVEGKPPDVHPDCLQDRDIWKARMALRADTRLLIVDPLASYLGRGVNDSKNAELRAVLEPFIKEVTRPRGVCMLCNAHLNKSVNSSTPIHRINGSVAYANLARSVSFVTRDKDDPTHRIFSQEKCNIAPDNLPAIGFRVETRAIPSEEGDIETAVPVFDAETIAGFSLHEAMASDKGTGSRGPDPSKRVALAEWLFDFLQANGNLVLAAKIFDAAGEAGHVGAQNSKGRWGGLNALYRAKDFVPQLTGDKAGWEVVTSNEDGSLRSVRGHAQWLLRPQGVAF